MRTKTLKVVSVKTKSKMGVTHLSTEDSDGKYSGMFPVLVPLHFIPKYIIITEGEPVDF